MNSQTLDLALICLGILVCWTGWRRGFVVSVFSILGLFFGVWIGRQLVDQFLRDSSNNVSRAGLNLLLMLVGLSVGSAVGSFIGRRIKSGLKWKPVKYVDHSLGSMTSLLTWSLVVWVIGTTLMSGPIPSIATVLSQSKVVAALDAYAPNGARVAIEKLRGYVSDSHLPESLVSGLLAPQVALPDPALTAAKNIQLAIDSVVRVEGSTQECQTRLTGSGFIVAPHVVITNAHVVAGVTNPVVRIKGVGRSYPAVVIYFDPKNDIALLRSDMLTSPPIAIGTQAARDTSLVAAGFPGGGSLKLIPGRVRSVAIANGDDIYGKNQVVREIYSIRAIVRQGDSGAPLLNINGQAVGLVFAASSTDPSTGYALTPTVFAKAIDTAKNSQTRVSTGPCSDIK